MLIKRQAKRGSDFALRPMDALLDACARNGSEYLAANGMNDMVPSPILLDKQIKL